MKLPEKLQGGLGPFLLGLIGGAITFALSHLIYPALLPLENSVVPAIPVQAWLYLCLLLLLLIGLLVWWVWWLHQQLKLDGIPNEFEMQVESGIAFDRKTRRRFCTACLHRKRKSELQGARLIGGDKKTYRLLEWTCIAPLCESRYTEREEISIDAPESQ